MIRAARISDITELLRLIKLFQAQSPIPMLAEIRDYTHIEQQLLRMIAGAGIVMVAQDKDTHKLVGVLAGIKSLSVWHPSFCYLTEVCFYVEESHRNTTTGYRLLKAYIDNAQTLQNTKQITGFTMGKMCNSPNLKYEKLGFRYIEETWHYEGNK